MTTKTKADILKQIQDARAALRKVVEAIPAAKLEQPGTEGTWAVRDVLGHIATWDEESVSRVRKLVVGAKPNASPSDFNEREVQLQRKLTTKAVQDLFVKNHEQAVAYLRGLPAEALQHPDVEKQVMGCMAHHYQEHAEHLRVWLAKS
ncbi:MAG: DinB family protein [Dehalococcoidia bacterium]|nr:DinB family protein [Dehalococcoidia bacterium]